MSDSLWRKAASIEDLRLLAQKRLPKFAYDYAWGGCNANYAIANNRKALEKVQLAPKYLQECAEVDLTTRLFGQEFSAPFGMAPIGLTGLIWPKAAEYQAMAAHQHEIPFVLSSVSTTSIEMAAQKAQENFFFQLYPPKDESILVDILKRCQAVDCDVLVVTIDVPSLSHRPADIRNGLSIPASVTPKSLFQAACAPRWSLASLSEGLPQFATLKPYLNDGLYSAEAAKQIRHRMRKVVDFDALKHIRDVWQGKLIVKGVLTVEDALLAAELGADGIIVSNHGGRQLDAAVSPIQVIQDIADAVGDKLTVMADSGVESGVDIARYLAAGAEFVFAGRAFIYGVAALRKVGASHAAAILKAELQQVMEQLRCANVQDLSAHYLLNQA